MPPGRIQHESHTCSEQSLRILMWNVSVSYVQKPLQLDLAGLSRRADSSKSQNGNSP